MIGCVTSKTTEDFTALQEMDPLKHMTIGRERESTPYWPMILYARRMVRRGQSYAVDSKPSIELNTQFVTHVLIRYSILPRPSFIKKWFCRGLDVSLSWGESRNTLHIHQWFCMLEGWSEERKELCCRFKTLNWLENSICCPRVNQVLRSAEAFFYQWMILSWFGHFLKLGRKQWIHSVSTNDFVC